MTNKVSIIGQFHRAIRNRILLLFASAVVVVSGLAVFEFRQSLILVRSQVNVVGKRLANKIIAEKLVNNDDAILSHLKDAQTKLGYEVYINPLTSAAKSKLHWTPPFSWHYQTPLKASASQDFGSLNLTGRFTEANFLNTIRRLSWLSLFFTSLLLLLRPLIVHIPRSLFVEPLRQIMKLRSDKCSKSILTNLERYRELEPVVHQYRQFLAEREEAEEKERNLEKYRTIGEVAQMVAHDIKKPFSLFETAILSSSGSQSVADFDASMSRIKQAFFNARNYIEFLLDDLEHIKDHHDLVTTNFLISEMITASVSTIFDARLYPNVKVDFQFDYDGFVCADRSKMMRVVINIFNNALENMGEHGRIWITTSASSSVDVIVKIGNENSYIPERERARLFEVFYSTRSQGSGLGLAIAKKILDSHQSRLECHSDVKKGTEFVFAVPIATAKTQSSAAKIVLLEDDPFFAEAFTQNLENISCLVFENPSELLSQGLTDISLIVCDYFFGNKPTIVDYIHPIRRLFAVPIVCLSDHKLSDKEKKLFDHVLEKRLLSDDEIESLKSNGLGNRRFPSPLSLAKSGIPI